MVHNGLVVAIGLAAFVELDSSFLQFGALGLLAAYLWWDRRDRIAQRSEERAEREKERQARLNELKVLLEHRDKKE